MEKKKSVSAFENGIELNSAVFIQGDGDILLQYDEIFEKKKQNKMALIKNGFCCDIAVKQKGF